MPLRDIDGVEKPFLQVNFFKKEDHEDGISQNYEYSRPFVQGKLGDAKPLAQAEP